MLVVPLEKDIILTKDKQHLKVVEYTNYKEGGPAVYCRTKTDKTLILIYFFDISEINGVKVDYIKGSKIFNALGKVERTQHLPQPDDTVYFKNKNKSEEQPERLTAHEVGSLRLKSRTLRTHYGMFVKDSDGNNHRLQAIMKIDRAIGGNNFNREAFLALYKDYLGV